MKTNLLPCVLVLYPRSPKLQAIGTVKDGLKILCTKYESVKHFKSKILFLKTFSTQLHSNSYSKQQLCVPNANSKPFFSQHKTDLKSSKKVKSKEIYSLKTAQPDSTMFNCVDASDLFLYKYLFTRTTQENSNVCAS